jgi:hypothetical protein
MAAMLPTRPIRIPRIVLIFLLCTLCIAWNPVEATTVGLPFVLTISVEDPASQTGTDSYTVKAGSEIFIKVQLKNTSKHNLSLDYDADPRTGVGFSHQYEVRDSSGSPAQKRPISHPETGSTGHGWPARILKPGESMDINGDRISRLYDLSQPGKYTIQLSRIASVDAKDDVVKSNTITVTVMP